MSDIKQRVEDLIKEVDSTHRYSMSRIFGSFNEVFNTNETPQTCASCLIRKVNDLREWLNDDKYIPPYLKHINNIG